MPHGNDKDPWFNASQMSWLIDQRGETLVDHVIRLEDLQQQKQSLAVCDMSGLHHASPTAMNFYSSPKPISLHQAHLCADHLDLTFANPSTHLDYPMYYDNSTSQILQSYMKEDIKLFHYKFKPAQTN